MRVEARRIIVAIARECDPYWAWPDQHGMVRYWLDRLRDSGHVHDHASGLRYVSLTDKGLQVARQEGVEFPRRDYRNPSTSELSRKYKTTGF